MRRNHCSVACSAHAVADQLRWLAAGFYPACPYHPFFVLLLILLSLRILLPGLLCLLLILLLLLPLLALLLLRFVARLGLLLFA